MSELGRGYRVRSREWRYRDGASDADIERLALETGLSRLTVRVCLNRGLDSAEKIHEFFEPALASLTHPFQIRDLEKAVDRLVQVRAQNGVVRVFGDYDVDGTCGGALLGRVLREFGFANVTVEQPDRFKDGYGLNVGAVERAHADGVTLLISVDCGITGFEPGARAKELGLEWIIVDHHQLDPERGLPDGAYAVIDPQRDDCDSGLKQVCGCGLAFYLAMGLRIRGRELGWFEERAEPNLKRHLDLVVMATAADQVPLTGDNRVLVHHGLQVVKHSSKVGVRALLEVSGIASRDLTPGDLGFMLGPRINASGRMGSASAALELLMTDDPVRSLELAQTLEAVNRERMDLQNAIWDEVRDEVDQRIREGEFKHGILVASESWHEGVVGIVASKVTERYLRPAAVLAIRDGIAKGSVRSFGGKNVLEALRCSAQWMLGFGGHQHAAGLTTKPEWISPLAQAFDQALSEIEAHQESLPLWIETRCEAHELSLEALLELEKMAPFGNGNPEPVIQIEASVSDSRILKERHLKVQLSTDQNTPPIEGIWFGAVERDEVMEAVKESLPQTWVGVPELNRWRGRVKPAFRIKDFRRN